MATLLCCLTQIETLGNDNHLQSHHVTQQPNILLIYADDLGYGDVACYNPQAKVETPHLDRLALAGVRCTDAHSPSTVCTPSRYGVMTGRMPFRLNYRGVFTGVGGPCLIKEDRLTLPGMLQKKGYATACIGKWHIGMTFRTSDGKPSHELRIKKKAPNDWRDGGPALEKVRQTDFSKPITDGPIHRGFDYFFGTACCPTTDWLYAYIEQDRVKIAPQEQLDRTNLPKHPYSFDNRRGLIAPDFDLEQVDLKFLEKSQAWMREHVRTNENKPFFLFHSMQAVHLPSFPAPLFQGKTKAGPHGDFIFECDFIVGELLKTLDELEIADNTLVIFSSDNGPEVSTSVHMRSDHNHDGARPFRGLKRDQWEGGHRVPFLARWPKQIPAGTVCDQTICQTDIMSMCAAITGFELPNNSAEDSFNIWPAIAGSTTQPIRPYTLHQTINLSLAVRKGPWKLLDHKGSGGNNYQRNKRLAPFAIPDTDPDAPGQLYNLESDPGETKNLYSQYPEVVKELKEILRMTKISGRSRP